LGTAHINQHLAILRVKDIDPHYLAAFLSLGPGRLQLKRLDRVGVKSGLNFDDVRSLRILLPPLPEQYRIAAILNKADAIRRKRAEATRLADVFLKSVFLDMFGDPIANSNGWNSKPLEDFVEAERGISYGVVQRGTDYSDGVPLIRINNILDNRLNHEGIVKADPAVEAKFRRTRLKGGELLLSIRGTIGRVAITPDWAMGWNVTREVAVIPLIEGINKDFVHYLLQTRGAQHFMAGEVRGVAQKGINLRDVRRLPVPMFPNELQNRFSVLVKHFHEHQDRTNHSQNELDDLFNSLVQRAFRGEL
jgi:type I restriction enzyme S subunit